MVAQKMSEKSRHRSTYGEIVVIGGTCAGSEVKLVRELQEDLSSAFVEIDQIKTIVTKLLPNTSHHEAIMDLQEAFSTLTVQQMRWFLRRADTAGTHVRFATTWPLSVFVLFESLLLLAT